MKEELYPYFESIIMIRAAPYRSTRGLSEEPRAPKGLKNIPLSELVI